MHPALEIEQLTVAYDKTTVLWDISATVPAGKMVAIVGPNGAGKSTLLKTALGFVQPLSGRVLLGGEPLQAARQKIAYVPQRETVDWDFPITVLELVLMGRYGRLGLFRRPRQADKEAALRTLAQVGMLEYQDRQISQLSGGQQQRCFLARALMQEADIFFLDEPMAGLDMASEKTIIEILQDLRKIGKSLFVVHHDLSTVGSIFDWVLLLNVRLVAAGPVADVLKPENLQNAYGKAGSLFSEAERLARERSTGHK